MPPTYPQGVIDVVARSVLTDVYEDEARESKEIRRSSKGWGQRRRGKGATSKRKRQDEQASVPGDELFSANHSKYTDGHHRSHVAELIISHS